MTPDDRPTITEAEAENRVSASIMRQLSGDPRYAYAESSEAQAEAEAEIGRETWERFEAKYKITP